MAKITKELELEMTTTIGIIASIWECHNKCVFSTIRDNHIRKSFKKEVVRKNEAFLLKTQTNTEMSVQKAVIKEYIDSLRTFCTNCMNEASIKEDKDQLASLANRCQALSSAVYDHFENYPCPNPKE